MKPSISFQDQFTNLNSLNAVKQAGRAGDKAALREVARQFEALFVQQMLKTMRATEDIFADGNFTQSNEMKFHRDMLDQQMSLEMTKGRGMGLAEVLFRELDRSYGKMLPPEKPTDDTITPAKPHTTENPPVVSRVSPENSADERLKPGFIDKIFSEAKAVADEIGVAVEGLIAQAALETGWGRFVLSDHQGTSSHNLFNIKAGKNWQGDTVTKNVPEYQGGKQVTETAQFRAYPDIRAAFTDLVDFLSKPRYQQALQSNDVAQYAQALQHAGYATDPNYAKKICRIADDPEFQQAVARNLL